MELARRAWKRSIIIYKTSLQSSLRNSSSSGSRAAAVACAPSKRDSVSGAAAAARESFADSKSASGPDGNLTILRPAGVDERISTAIGTTDELSSYIGLAREFACDSKAEHPYVDKLKRVQMILFDLSNAISKAGAKSNNFENKHTKDLEEWISEYANQLPPPEDYIIPGGGKASASLHVARTICRRAERTVCPLVRDGALDEEAQVYLNRLSEFLLTVSRMAAKCDQRTENIYIPRSELSADDK